MIEGITEEMLQNLMRIELNRKCKDANGGGCMSLLTDNDTCIYVPIEKCPQKMGLFRSGKIKLPNDCKNCKHNGVWIINQCSYYNRYYNQKCSKKRSINVTINPNSFLFKFCCWHARVFSPEVSDNISFAHRFLFSLLCGIFGTAQILLYSRISQNFSAFITLMLACICSIVLPKLVGLISTPLFKSINIYKYAEDLVSREQIEVFPVGTFVFGFLFICLEVAVVCRVIDLLKG